MTFIVGNIRIFNHVGTICTFFIILINTWRINRLFLLGFMLKLIFSIKKRFFVFSLYLLWKQRVIANLLLFFNRSGVVEVVRVEKTIFSFSRAGVIVRVEKTALIIIRTKNGFLILFTFLFGIVLIVFVVLQFKITQLTVILCLHILFHHSASLKFTLQNS